MRIRLFKREAAAYIKLRRLGYSISTLARAFGRSQSVIFRRIQAAVCLGSLARVDLRKMPNRTRILSRAFQWARIMKYLPAWNAWILGEGEKPP